MFPSYNIYIFGIHCILCLYIYRHLWYLKGTMLLKLIIRWWFWLYHFWCIISSALSKSSWKCHLISSSQVEDHSIVMVHWYGTWMTSMSFLHSTSVVTCRVCISPRAHQDNKVITIQSLGHTQSNPILHTWFGRKPSKFLKNGCDVNMAWALSVKNDVINEILSSLSSRRLSISLNTRIQMCIRLRALVLSMVLIGLKCVVYLASCLSV